MYNDSLYTVFKGGYVQVISNMSLTYRSLRLAKLPCTFSYSPATHDCHKPEDYVIT